MGAIGAEWVSPPTLYPGSLSWFFMLTPLATFTPEVFLTTRAQSSRWLVPRRLCVNVENSMSTWSCSSKEKRKQEVRALHLQYEGTR